MSNERCGFVTIVGRPNVGKSTLLNKVIGKKLSITSHKPQTTRFNLYGIKTKDNHQAVFIDTPGIHSKVTHQLNRWMNKQAKNSLKDVDVVMFMVQAGQWTEEDARVYELLSERNNIFLIINKVDMFKDKSDLLPYMQKVQAKCPEATLVPISAFEGDQVEKLMNLIWQALPFGPFHFPPEMICSHSNPYHMTESIREKILRLLDQEVPYCASVQLEHMSEREKCFDVSALIWVEREGQKKIVIGPKGDHLKTIGTHARRDIENLLGKKVNLKLWVKVKSGWRDNASALAQLGYTDGMM